MGFKRAHVVAEHETKNGDYHRGFIFEGEYSSFPPAWVLHNLRHWVDTCKAADARDYVISKVQKKIKQNYIASQFPPEIMRRVLLYAAYRHWRNNAHDEILERNGLPPQERRR